MKKLIIVFFAITLFNEAGNAISIKSNEPEVIRFKSQMVKTIASDFQKFQNGSIHNEDPITILTYPTCYLKQSFSNTKSVNNSNILQIDTSLGFALLMKKGLLYAFADKTYDNYIFSFPNINNSRHAELKMLFYAQKFSKNIFFVNLLKSEGNKNDLVGFYKQGKVSYIDLYLHYYNSLEDVLKIRYGSVQKYKEIVELNRYEENETARVSSFDKAKENYRNDYKNWMYFFPNDTSRILSLFIKEMEQYTGLSPEQANLINEKIKRRFKDLPVDINDCGIPLCGINVTSEVKSVLTRDQFEKYSEYRDINDRLSSKAFSTVCAYLIDKKEVSRPSPPILMTENSIRDIMIKDIMLNNN